MIDKRPQAGRILIAEIWGEARRRARWRDLGSDEETAAVTDNLTQWTPGATSTFPICRAGHRRR